MNGAMLHFSSGRASRMHATCVMHCVHGEAPACSAIMHAPCMAAPCAPTTAQEAQRCTEHRPRPALNACF